MAKLQWKKTKTVGYNEGNDLFAEDPSTGFSYYISVSPSGFISVFEVQHEDLMVPYTKETSVLPRDNLKSKAEAMRIAEEWKQSAPARKRKALRAGMKDSGMGRTRRNSFGA